MLEKATERITQLEGELESASKATSVYEEQLHHANLASLKLNDKIAQQLTELEQHEN